MCLGNGLVAVKIRDVLPSVRGAWCPICLSRLGSDFVCPRHGQMRAVLDLDPSPAAAGSMPELALHLDRVGVADLEASC